MIVQEVLIQMWDKQGRKDFWGPGAPSACPKNGDSVGWWVWTTKLGARGRNLSKCSQGSSRFNKKIDHVFVIINVPFIIPHGEIKDSLNSNHVSSSRA